MATTISKRIIFQTFPIKLLVPLKIEICFLSNSPKLYSKRKLNIKNEFTFKNEFQRKLYNVELADGRIVSSDLLQNQTKANRIEKRRIPLVQKPKSPLTYRGEIVFGIHPVYLALLQKRRTLYQLYVREQSDSSDEESSSLKDEIIKLAESAKIPISFVDTKGLKILAPGAVHQGVCLDAGYLPLCTWNKNESECSDTERIPLWLVLDEILDPMNVGAIIRSAYYFGISKIFTVLGNSCKLSPTVSKASSGALEVMNMYLIEDLEDFVKHQKKNGWCIVSTTAYSEKEMVECKPPIRAAEFNAANPTILILGNEGRGISKNVMNLCDSLISIEPAQKLHQGIDSLNVSVASGVILYTLHNAMNYRR